MTNPDNIVRVRARNGGRASVYEANGWCQAFSTGLLEGNGVIQNTSADMNVLVGGSTTKPDVVIAQNASGYKIALDLVGQHAVTITAPASNKRISAIVAYTNDLSLSTTEDTVTGSPASCGLIVVNGTTASSPSAPTDTQIRNAISSDGATGSQAAYCVIATITVSSSTSVITNSEITTNKAGVTGSNIDFTTLSGNYSTSEVETGFTWIDGKKIYKKTTRFTVTDRAMTVAHGISSIDKIINAEGIWDIEQGTFEPINRNAANQMNQQYNVGLGDINASVFAFTLGSGMTPSGTAYVTLYYTKSS